MALSVSSLANRIASGIETAFNTPSNPQLLKFANAMASAIIAEITTNAVVNTSIPVSTSGTGTVVGSTVTVNSTGSTTSTGTIS